MAPEPAPPAAAAPSSPARRLRSRLQSRRHRLARDCRYLLPGLPIAAVGFAVLVSLTIASVATLVVWVGALLLPLTLLLGSRFADLSRARLRAWGMAPAPVQYLPRGGGLLGLVRVMTDRRRWFDLAFEAVLAFPLRLVTFVLAVTWTAVAAGSLTRWIWWPLSPVDGAWPVRLLVVLDPALVPQSAVGAYLVDAGAHLLLGLLFLLTLPAVLHGLARADALVTNALLGGEEEAHVTQADSGERPQDGARHPHLTAPPATRWVWASTCVAAVALLAVAWPVLATLYLLHPAVALVLAVAHSAGIVLAVRWPWLGIALSTSSSLAAMLVTFPLAGLPWPWPVTGMIAQCLLVAVLALRHQWYWVVAGWGAGTLLTALAFVIPGRVPGGLANGVVLVSLTAALAMLGVLERLWRQGAVRAQQAEQVSAEEAQRRRDLEERNRIARELHDVVAHSMSVIHVQASTALYRKPGIDPSVQQEFDDIAASSRQALSEMRALLALLRSDTAAPTAPAPVLADIPDLVETARASGATITDSIETDAPATVGLTAYRIVQEGLSNALRHAPGAEIEVTTAFDDDGSLIVQVANSAPSGAAAPAAGSGLGLAGIRERVGALGGTVTAGPTPAGGYRLVAVLPVVGDQHDPG